MTEILLVDDDAAIRRLLRAALEKQGLRVHEATSLAAARRTLQDQTCSIVVVDPTLPDGSGLDLLDDVDLDRSSSHVIVLSGSTTESDRLRAFEAGADDYVTKPFFVRELVARILAVHRRQVTEQHTNLEIGSLHLNVVARTATIDGAPLQLTAKEFDLLAFLGARPSLVFTRDALLRLVWGSSSEWQQPSTVTEHIRRLRAKVEVDPRHPQLLRTVRGAGYRLDPPVARKVEQVAGPTGVVIHVDGSIVSADDAAAALVGCTQPEELIGRSILDFVAPSSSHSARERMTVTDAGAGRRSQVLSVLRGDGHEVPVEVASSTVDWLGARAGRIELSPAIAPSVLLSQLVTGVASEVADAVIVTDLNLHVRSWNGGAERMYGWAEHEVIGRHVLDVLEWNLDVNQLERSWQQLDASDRWFGEAHHVARDGSAVDVWASATRVRDGEGEPIAVVSVNRPSQSAAIARRRHPSPEEIADLQRGIDHDEFEVHYQPVVDLTDRQIVSVEALVRWRHPDRGLLGPAEFIDTAEHSGLIVPLGAFVLRTACDQVSRWRSNGSGLSLEVNLSATELAAPGLVLAVSSALATSGLDATALWLEITETSLVEDLDTASTTLHQLAATGVGLSIDDFGTGWASLTYLRAFPIKMLKIDQVFVAGVDTDPHDLAIVRSVLALGAELGLAVVAEGIETPAQEQALLDLGCAMGQGFLYGRPTPAAGGPPDPTRSTQPEEGPPSATDARHRPPLAAGSGASCRSSAMPASGAMMRSVAFDRIGASAAVLDGSGTIVDTNEAWRVFTHLNEGTPGVTGVGADYLATCDRSAAGGDVIAAAVAAGLREILTGERVRFDVEYPCPSPVEDRWFLLEASAAPIEDGAGAVILHTDITAKRVLAAGLVVEADRDGLTGLPNRRHALAHLADRLAEDTPVGVIFLDLDGFEGVNDHYGHPAGDELLVKVASRIRRQVGADGLVARYGGDEFLVITSGDGCDLAGVQSMGDRIRDVVVRPFQTGAQPVSVGVSFGVATRDGHDDVDGAVIVRAADAQMCLDKQRRRDRRRHLEDVAHQLPSPEGDHRLVQGVGHRSPRDG